MEASTKELSSETESREVSGQINYSMLQPSYGEKIIKSMDLKLAKLESMILNLRY